VDETDVRVEVEGADDMNVAGGVHAINALRTSLDVDV
jgi:hypothetical protein